MLSKNEVVRVGLVGYGMSGQAFHAPTISCVPELTLAKVVERHAKKSKERYPQVEVVDSPEKLPYRNIYGAITGREELIVKPEEARNAIRMIEAAKQSARGKKAVAFSL
ncbi:scyllo-inositol 2-dehydrogenase (NADP(+)) [Peptococcaceae bacterium CEB3]|nr:scyllo-inositol 2-dehydrogenase (NADP(+)) [Peptococcaceae bacterium CEB3]